jgi:tetratricopeptide (TPR) repeat protein
MSGIFISYRREDSQALAGRLSDRLAQRFGRNRVFRDIDAIEPGARFAEVISQRIAGCDALVALIGPHWLHATDAEGRRRLSLRNDLVKAEIAEALAQRKLVIPVLIEGTAMPHGDELPPEIASLAEHNALPLSDARFEFDTGRLASAIGKVIPPDASLITSPDLWALIQQRLRQASIPGLVALSLLVSWWQWDHISTLPGVKRLVTWATEKPLPKAKPDKFNIAVARLEGDEKRETERLILQSLAEFPGVATLSFDRMVASDQADLQEAEREGHQQARTLLKVSGADILIWGVVLRQGNKSLPKLYWTPAADMPRSRSSGRYQMTETLAVPIVFWQDLTTVLALLVATGDAEFTAQYGRYTADKLMPFIQRVRALLQSSTVESWDGATREEVRVILGNALLTHGDQSGQNEPLHEAVANYRDALKEVTREKVPLAWAMIQNNLGNALRVLGERESGTARLEEAVTAYREALKEYTREKLPLDWAMGQSNVGTALRALGERESGTARLEEAVIAYREALKEYTREKLPLDWALTQNRLGNALWTLGNRQSGTARLEEAVTAYREALKEYPREKVPLDWAMTQNNLGTALMDLGDRDSSPPRLQEAVTAYREALKERTREKVPLEWAMTQNNLGTALRALGERESGTARLEEAVTAYREALKERTREKVPLAWARTQNNLGNALQALGDREAGTARLQEAAAAFEAALVVFRDAKADYYVQVTQRNLKRAQAEIMQRKEISSVATDKTN